MRRRAGLHHHEPHRLVLKPALELATREPRSLDHFPVLVGDDQLKNVLGKINSNGSSIHLGRLLSIVLKPPKASAGTMMPNKEREESIPSLVTDTCVAALRAFFSAAQRGRWADQVTKQRPSMRLRLSSAIAVLLVAAALAAEAQPAGRPARVGFLTPSSKASFESDERRAYREAFTGRLRELGWTEGHNLAIESRYAEGAYDRLQPLAVELVNLPVDVIFANSAPAALAAKRATTSIPIVFETLGEPISAGLVSSLARPEGNLTGISGLGPELSGKRLELLRELVPGLRRVVLLVNPGNVMTAPTVHETEKAAAILRLRIDVVEVRRPEQIETGIGGIGGDAATAVIIVPDPMLLSHARRIQALLLKYRLPAVHAETGWLQAGGLMLFGSSLLDHFRQTATLVDKILRGARVTDLPVEQSTKFELIINLKTAKALGLTVSPSLLVRADRVVE